MNGVVNPPPRKLRWVLSDSLQPNISFPNGLCPLPSFLPRARGPCRLCLARARQQTLNVNLDFLSCIFSVKWGNPYFVSSYLSFIDLESKIKLQFRPGRLCAYLRACLPACQPAPLLLPSLVSHDITINVLTFTTPPLLRERGRTDHQPGQEKMGILAANNGPNPSRQRSEVTYFVWRED